MKKVNEQDFEDTKALGSLKDNFRLTQQGQMTIWVWILKTQ